MGTRTRPLSLKTLLAATLVSLWVLPALAQTNADPAQRLLKERELEELRKRAKAGQAGADLSAPAAKPIGPAKPTTPAPLDDTCFKISRINVSGQALIKGIDATAIVAAHRKPCLRVADIQALILAFNKAYAEAGYVTTRGYVPEQDVRSGTLQIKIVEGVVEKITYREQRGDAIVPGPYRKIETSFPVKLGEPLQLRALEQGLDQINRVSSNKATMDIKPGKQTGGSELVITSKIHGSPQGPLRTQIKHIYTADRSPIEQRGDLIVEADNLLKANDTWYVAYSGSPSSNSLSLQASVPYHWLTFSGSASYSESQQQLTATTEMLTQNASVAGTGSYLIARDAKSKLRADLNLTQKWSQRFINAAELTPQALTVARAGINWEQYLPGAFLSLSPGISVGPGVWSTPYSGRDGSPEPKFVKADLSGVYQMSTKTGWIWSPVFAAQASHQVLLNTEHMSIGGATSVRGFARQQATGESGAYVQSPLTIPVAAIVSDAKRLEALLGKTAASYVLPLNVYGFIDAGWVYDNANTKHQHLVSAGAGLNYTKDRFAYDLYVARPLLHSEAIKASEFEIRSSVTVKLY